MVNKSLPSEKLRKHVVPFAGVAGFLKRKNFVQACIRVCPGFARTRRPGACGGLVELRPGALRGGRARSSDRTVARCVGRTSALLVSRRRAQLPVGAVIVGRQTMFMPPPTKKASQPLMSGQRDVDARAGAAPTGAAATGGAPTPLREEPLAEQHGRRGPRMGPGDAAAIFCWARPCVCLVLVRRGSLKVCHSCSR